MSRSFISGVFRTVVYYAIGFSIAGLSYLIFGWEYKHSLGYHHIIGFLVMVGGLLWTVSNVIRLIQNKNVKYSLGSLIINSIVIGVYVVLFIREINKGKSTSVDVPKKENEITFSIDKNTDAFIGINGLGDTVYKKIGDSVIIDKVVGNTWNDNNKK